MRAVVLALSLFAACKSSSPTNPDAASPSPDARMLTAELTPSAVTLDDQGDTALLTLILRDQAGTALGYSGDEWTSSDPAVASVVSSGRIRSGMLGTATITVHVEGVVATATVTVLAQPNAACTPPTAPGAPPPVGAPGTWLYNAVDTHYDPPAQGPRFGEWVTALDLDADGDMDLLTDHSSISTAAGMIYNHLRAWRNAGNAQFTDATAALLGGQMFGIVQPTDPELIDIDGDGRLDALLGEVGYDPGGFNGADCSNTPCPGGRDHILSGSSAGLRDLGATAFPAINGFSHGIGGADVDCDGDVDVMQGRWTNGSAPDPSHLLINDGAMHFTAEDARIALPRELISLRFCDLDRDGDPEAFVSEANGGRGRLYENNGFGRFRQLPASAIPAAPPGDAMTQYLHPLCSDIDLDGYPDLLLPLYGFFTPDNSIRVLHNNGDLSFTDVTATTLVKLWPDGGAISDFFVADFNEDGWPDLFVANQALLFSRVYWNRGGTFEAGPPWPAWPDPRWVLTAGLFAVADFDGDGRPDIFVDRGPYESGMVLSR